METQTDNDQLLTCRQAAIIVGLSHVTIAKWIKLGVLKRVLMPGTSRIRIRKGTLIETVRKMETSVSLETLDEKEAGNYGGE